MATGNFTLKQVNQAIAQGAWSGYMVPRWVEYLVVAGGGGGAGVSTGSAQGEGGGGAGGLLTGIVTVAAGASYTVTVGGAGAGGGSNASGTQGDNSVFGSITTTGGGRGTANAVGGNGGSGGGGGRGDGTNFFIGGQGITGQGNSGARGLADGQGGGGGGAGTVGLFGSGAGAGVPAGNGGAGIASAISGTVTTYAGGGGGGCATSGSGAGGVGGGGNGGVASAGFAGTVNTGGGGGGAGGSGTFSGGAGGSGIVIVRYPGTVQFFTGGTVNYAGGHIVHTFYSSGTLAPTAPTPYSNTFQISRSLRFNSADSAYLSRTPGSATNRKTFTWSGWVKRSALPAAGVPIFSTEGTPYSQYLCFGGTDMTALTTDALCFFSPVSGSAFSVQSASVYRDESAWYHIVCAVDTTQATAANRVRLYVNGSEVSYGSSTYPALNLETYINSTGLTNIGSTAATYFRGYITEVNFIDGQALAPSSFGEYDVNTGVWVPRSYGGSYGTNGFKLNFSDNSNTTAATLGADSSGNGNNFTPNNFSVTAGVGNDSFVDTPTPYGTDTGAGGEVRGNYATLNPLHLGTASSLTNGSLTFSSTSSSGNIQEAQITGTFGIPSSGKWYFEATPSSLPASIYIGVVSTTHPMSSTPFTGTPIRAYRSSTGNKSNGGTDSAYGNTYTTSDVIGVAVDMDAGSIYFYKNNTIQNSGTAAFTDLAGTTWIPYCVAGSSAATVTGDFNFGQRPFAYTAPSGFKALCTQNLPTPTIGATSNSLATQYFDVNTWTGNGTSQTITNSGGFQPDWVWTKGRSNADSHILVNAVTGANQFLLTDATQAEATSAALVSAFTSSGFSIGSSTSINRSSSTYVGWQWKANGAGSTNTAGSITSTVSASTTSGFSVVTYTGTGANATVGHGLGVAPSMVIIKSRQSGTAEAWITYHISLTAGYNIRLNATEAQANDGQFNGAFTSSVFTLATLDGSNHSAWAYVAYCFAPIAGYSAFGSYTGNGSANGPFVYTGFRPRFILWKNTTSVYDWQIVDTARDTYNASGIVLQPNSSNAEADGRPQLDILSNGFKIRASNSVTNESASTFIYMAFAENPFKYSLAR